MTVSTVCYIGQTAEGIALVGVASFNLSLRITVFIEYRVAIFISDLRNNQG